MKRIFAVLFCILFCQTLLAQQHNFTVSGTVKDTVNFQFTQYTAVSLIRTSDSILQTFTRSDAQGHFTLQADSAGQYILLFEHPHFATYVDHVYLSGVDTNLGLVPMMSRKNLLQDIVIVGKNTITIKGDTIEYAADSFKTGQYDNVDALLRQLPGIEVSSDGSIKAYGQTVQKMLVDGEEFFSDDPAMVAKMLRASSVKSVQVYDSKSKQAQYTGIDDGKKIKTINLKLKDNAKRGYFGRVSAGGGLPNYWQNEAIINAFKKKRKLSAFAIMSNTAQGGLGFMDRRKFNVGQGGNMSFSGGGVHITPGNNSLYGFNGQYTGQGLPKSWQGGVHYNNSWMHDSATFDGSYYLSKNDFSALNNTVTKYILPDTQYFNNNHSDHYQSNWQHNISLSSEYDIDSTSSIELDITGTLGKNLSRDNTNSSASSLEGILLNENDKHQTSNGNNQNFNGNLTYHKKFKKKGRSFSANLSTGLDNSHSEGVLQSTYHLFALDTMQEIDQRKVNDNRNLTTGLNLTYTEPIAKKMFLLFDYHLNVNNQNAHVQSFNHLPGVGGYEDVLDSLYSSQYSYHILENRGGVSFQYNPSDKIHFNVGGDIAKTRYTQHDLMYDSTTHYSYFNFFPSLSFKYSKSQMSSFQLTYSGRSEQPSMTQLQPVRDNSDPLNVAIGNPDLKQAFVHDLNMFYYNYQVLSGRSWFLMGNFTYTQNAFALKQNMDISGRRTYQYVNVNGNYMAMFNAHFGRKIVGRFRGSLGLTSLYNKTYNFTNNQANINNSWSVSPNLSLRYNLDTTLHLNYSFSPSYNSSVSTIRTDIKTNYWNFTQSLNVSYQLPWNFKIGTKVDWQFRQQLNANDRQNKVFLWDASLSRSFLKDKSLVLKIYANDILNQNVGYSRVTTAEQISESTYNTIQRYVMLSLTWNFTHTGGKKSKSAQKQNLDNLLNQAIKSN